MTLSSQLCVCSVDLHHLFVDHPLDGVCVEAALPHHLHRVLAQLGRGAADNGTGVLGTRQAGRGNLKGNNIDCLGS